MADPTGYTPRPKSVREAVFTHWGLRCFYCNNPGHRSSAPNDGGLQLDHLWPRSRGGSDAFENLVPVCPSCNGKKGTKWPGEFMAWQRGCRIDRLTNDSRKWCAA